MANTNISPLPAEVNLSPGMFMTYARQYIQCEQAFKLHASNSPVPYFLLCRAIELAIKARHLELQSRESVKKNFGHNIRKAYDSLPTDKKRLTALEYQVLKNASSIYDTPNKGFEYVSVWSAVTGFSDFPDLDVLRIIAAAVASPEA